ncbi:MAG: hypothetical protein H7177_07205 [Rhizobacter sp.]|nr:hypothetical protein [Bacteriovorax sp.]
MKNYRAKRISLTQANICNDDDGAISLISWPAVKIWSCENAVNGDPYNQNKNLGTYPSLIINGMNLIARRKLLTNKFFGNEYEISLWDEDGQCKISAYRPGWLWGKTEIKYNNQTYFLIRKKFFQFNYTLQDSETRISLLTDVTSFFTLSSYREFLLSLEKPIDPILITFSFFLAHNEFF